MRRIVHYETARQNSINITAKGLTEGEAEQITELVRKIARKRSRENRQQLLYDLIFN